jgi:Uma2 family endonuclease
MAAFAGILVAWLHVWRDNHCMATLPAYDDPRLALVSVREYLATSYRPDCDYVDGRIEERNVGEYDHGFLQTLLAHLFMNHREEWGVRPLTDVRMQVSSRHFRVPDLVVLRQGVPKEPVLTHPPLLVIEILSPEDRLGRFQDRIDDYLGFGIENIWIIDPERRTAHRATRTGLHIVETAELTVPETPIRVVLSELFAELDQA